MEKLWVMRRAGVLTHGAHRAAGSRASGRSEGARGHDIGGPGLWRANGVRVLHLSNSKSSGGHGGDDGECKAHAE